METENAVKENPKLQSVPALANLWKWKLRMYHGGVAVPLTRKEYGQLKMLSNKLGDLAPGVVKRSLENWGTLCFEAQCDAALPCSPSVPHLGFLLAHSGTAIKVAHLAAKRTKEKSADDIEFIRKVDQRIAQQKNEAQEDAADSPQDDLEQQNHLARLKAEKELDDYHPTVFVHKHLYQDPNPYNPSGEELANILAELEKE